MEAGKTYQIDMTSAEIDSYLHLEDADGKLVGQDDDGGGFPNAGIVFRAVKTGKHRIIATAFDNKVGQFSLMIRQVDGAKKKASIVGDGEPSAPLTDALWRSARSSIRFQKNLTTISLIDLPRPSCTSFDSRP